MFRLYQDGILIHETADSRTASLRFEDACQVTVCETTTYRLGKIVASFDAINDIKLEEWGNV